MSDTDKYKAMIQGETQFRYWLELEDKKDRNAYLLTQRLENIGCHYESISENHKRLVFPNLGLIIAILSRRTTFSLISSNIDLYDSGDTASSMMSEDRVVYYLDKICNIHNYIGVLDNPILEYNSIRLLVQEDTIDTIE